MGKRLRRTGGGHSAVPDRAYWLGLDAHMDLAGLIVGYIPMAKGFVYLTGVVDVDSRRVLTHKVAITLEACHAREIIEEALARFGKPELAFKSASYRAKHGLSEVAAPSN